MRFMSANINGARQRRAGRLPRRSVPDMFKVGRDVVVAGTLADGVFVSKHGTLITKCPSKYQAAEAKS